MNATIAVLRLELSERSRLFGVATVLALIPFGVAAMPSLRTQWGEVLVTVAMFLAIIYSLALATAFGASTIAAPLAEKRLSFYLAKPIPTASLWVGKFVAAMTISAAMFAIVSIPARIVAPADSAPWGVNDSWLSYWTLAAMPVLFLVTHALSTIIRSRSARLALDLILMIASVGAVLMIGRALFAGEAFVALGRLLLAIALTFVAILAIAPLYQLSKGRADVRRSHAALSNFLWISVAVVVGVAALYAWWVTSAPLSSIRNFSVIRQSSGGTWVVAAGESTRGRYRAAWLANTVTGEKQRLGGMVPWSGPAISEDGRTSVAVRLGGFPSPRPTEIVLSAIEQGGRSGSIAIDDWPLNVALTSDASRIVVTTSSKIAAYDTASGKLLAAVRAGSRRVLRIAFISPDVVRLVTSERAGANVTIDEFDLKSRAYQTTGHLPDAVWPILSSDSSRMLTRSRRARIPTQTQTDNRVDASVVDGRTGATLFRLPTAAATLLGDGRAAYISDAQGKALLQVTDTSGVVTKTIALPVDFRRFVGQAGELLIMGSRNAIAIVDLRRSTVRQIEGAVVRDTDEGGRLSQYDSNGVIVGFDEQKKLSAWSLATGAKREL